MKLIVGLGNPGAKYAGHRHNIGFMALDQIARDHNFPAWKSKHRGSVSEGRFGSDRIVLLKPETFMNKSGDSVGAALRFYKIEPEDIIVFHDEIDLAPGKVRFKMGGGHAGHNGLRSIHANIGPDYRRVRLGVGHPGHKDRVPGFVLHDFAKSDQDWLDDVLRGCGDGAPYLAAGDSGRFLNAVALRVSPPRSGTGKRAEEPPAAKTPSVAGDSRSPLQKLADRFR
ncbi:MAG: aminoacyl-tRNA hydrolase [Pseudomonadota bacterium]